MLKAKQQAAADKAQSNMRKDGQLLCIRMIGQTNWWVYGRDGHRVGEVLLDLAFPTHASHKRFSFSKHSKKV
jgi:hypothetical protein